MLNSANGKPHRGMAVTASSKNKRNNNNNNKTVVPVMTTSGSPVTAYLFGFVVFKFGRVDCIAEIHAQSHHLVHPQTV